MDFDNFLKTDIIDSTNEWAKRDVSTDNTIYIADMQTLGKGRGVKSWVSPKGENLYFSIKFEVKNYKIATESLFITSLSIVKAIKDIYNFEVEIKWPNDILIDNKKVSGVLSEIITRDKKIFLIIGIGINCNFNIPKELLGIATSLHTYVGVVDREKLLKSIVLEFGILFDFYQINGFNKILDRWNEYSKIVGRQIYTTVAKEKKRVTVTSLNSDGSLVVRDGKKMITIIAGDIEYA